VTERDEWGRTPLHRAAASVLFGDADVEIDLRGLMFPFEPWAAEDLHALFRHFDGDPR
jgi:hypothetical protein